MYLQSFGSSCAETTNKNEKASNGRIQRLVGARAKELRSSWQPCNETYLKTNKTERKLEKQNRTIVKTKEREQPIAHLFEVCQRCNV